MDVLDAEVRARLREVAEAATPGPWESYALPDPGPNRWTMVGVGVKDDELGHRTETMFREDAAHIAAFSPEVALALLDAADRLARLERLVRDYRAVAAHNPEAWKRYANVADDIEQQSMRADGSVT